MAKAKIKETAKKRIIGFNNSGKPLGERDDIDTLAIMAHQSQDRTLLDLFEVLPPLEELQDAKTSKALAEAKPPADPKDAKK